MITLKETVELTCNHSINGFSDILGKKIRENYRAEDGAVSRLELFYLMTVMPDIIVERKNFYRQIFHLENQIVFSSLTGHQTCSKTEPGGILSLRQPQNIRAAAAVRLVARWNKPENRQEIHLKIETRNLSVKDGKEFFGRGPWDKSGEYGPFGEMQRSMHKQLKTEHFHVLNDYGTGVFITEKRVLKLFSRLEREKWNGTENKSLAELTENNALSDERLVNVENDIRMSEKSLIHSVNYPAASRRGIKLAAQQSCGKFAPCGSRQIFAPTRLPGLLLVAIKNITFQTESLMRGQDKIVLISKGLTEPKEDIALQSNFLADSAGDIDIIQRSEKSAEPNGGIVEYSRGFSEYKRNFIWQRERLSESNKELILQRGKQLESKKKGIQRSENPAEPKGEIVKLSRYFLYIKRDFIQQREKQSEWKKEFILQRGKLSEPIKELIQRSETLAESKREIIKQSKIFSEFEIGLIRRSEKQSELKGNIIQQSRILPELKRELIQRVEKQLEQRGDLIQRSRILPESKRENILQTGNLAEPQTEGILQIGNLAKTQTEHILQDRNLKETQTERILQDRNLAKTQTEYMLQDRNLTEIKRELLPQRENFAKSITAAVLTHIKQINFDSKIILRGDNYLNLWDKTTLKTKSTMNLRDSAVWQTKEMANLHGSSTRQTESLTEPMEDTTRKEEPLIHLPDQPKPQADAIQPKQGQTDDQKLFQYLCEINEHNLNMQRRLEQIKPEAQNEIPLAIDKKEARKKSLLALKDPEKVLMEIDRSGGNPMSKTDSKVQSILNLADQDTRLLLEDVMAYPKTGQGRAFQITETDMGGLNHFLREMAEEAPGFQEISRETEKIQRDAEEIRKETVKITREELEKNSRVLMQNVEELLQSKIESVSDRVYRELERRLKNDQRRRGY